MEFENNFSVKAPVERVWSYLLDVQAVAPCVPGAALTEVVSDTEYKGTVKIKLGAVQVNYRGTLVLKEVDDAAHRVVISASGSETRGTGSASGTVTSTITQEDANTTSVHMVSEIVVTGRVAQFGRNIMQDVANRLIREFAKCLEANLTEQGMQTAAGAQQTATGTDGSGGAGVRAHGAPTEATVADPATIRDGSEGDDSGAASESKAAVDTSSLSHAKAEDEEISPAGDAKGSARTDSGPQAAFSSTPPATAQSPGSSYKASELKILPLLVDVTRSRLARGFRSIASLVDPDK